VEDGGLFLVAATMIGFIDLRSSSRRTTNKATELLRTLNGKLEERVADAPES